MAILRQLSPENCSHIHICLGTISKAVVKDSELALPRVQSQWLIRELGSRSRSGTLF